MAKEINLVPDIKYEAIRAIKVRNWTFFICMIVAGVCAAVLLILGATLGGQNAALKTADNSLKNMSEKLEGYDDLSDFLTIQNQLEGLSSISDNKKVLSRIFGVLSVMQPTNGDQVTFSELTVNFEDEEPVINFEAQADAKVSPYIDYNVLDAFKKNLNYIKYDYGHFVDKNGWEIPAYCIVENADDGSTLAENGNVYAYWLINEDGCKEESEEDSETLGAEALLNNLALTEGTSSSSGSTNSRNTGDLDESEDAENDEDTETECDEDDTECEEQAEERKNEDPDYEYVDYDGKRVVKIWRTVQYDQWYKDGHLDLDGNISGVAHFESSCYSRSGEEKDNVITWTETNSDCLVVPDGADGITITDSSNGRDSDDNLVLRFSASINLNPEVFSFKNKHVLMVGPSGYINVTDSYTQIQNMFGERATDCETGDASCYTTMTGNSSSDESADENNNEETNSRNNYSSNTTNGGNN